MLLFLAITTASAAALLLAGLLFVRRPEFGRLPQGTRLERVRRSPNYRDGAFRNRHATPQLTSGKGRLRTMLGFLFRDRSRLRPEGPLPAVRTDLGALPADRDWLVWFGHSSYLLQVGGIRVLVDPVFCKAAPLAFLNEPFAGTDIYTPEQMPAIDILLITHDHWDHLDYETVVRLKNRIGRVVCPLGVGEHFERWGFSPQHLLEPDWAETVAPLPDVLIHCLPARHFSGRGLRANQSLWASFLLEFPTRSIFVGGDGGYDTHFALIGARFPDIDLAILENGQYDTDWRYIHTLPEELPRIVRELGARRVVTVHHSKYALARHPWEEPLETERRLADAVPAEIRVPAIGEPFYLDDSPH